MFLRIQKIMWPVKKQMRGHGGGAEANCFLNFLYASIESHEGDISLVLTKGKNYYRTKF